MEKVVDHYTKGPKSTSVMPGSRNQTATSSHMGETTIQKYPLIELSASFKCSPSESTPVHLGGNFMKPALFPPLRGKYSIVKMSIIDAWSLTYQLNTETRETSALGENLQKLRN